MSAEGQMPAAVGRPSVLFFAKLRDPSLLQLIEFYREDLEVLKELGLHVKTETRLRRGIVGDGDVLYAWWAATALPVVISWRLRGKRVILTGAVDLRNPVVPLLRRVARLSLGWLAYLLANERLAISEYERRDLRLMGIRRVRLACCSIDTDFFVPSSLSSAPMAVTVAQLNLASIERKGVFQSIIAAQRVRDQIPDFTLHVIGPIAREAEPWLDERRRRGELDGVVIHGRLDRAAKRDLLAKSWFYFQPSAYEGFGVAVVEAMSCGALPIVSNAGGLPEVVGDAGVILDGRNPSDFAAACLAAVESGAVARDRYRRRDSSGRFSRAVRRQAISEALSGT